MTDGYGWLKLAHITAVIVWLGGSLTLSIFTGAFLRSGNRAALEVFFKEAGFFGPMIVGPASLLTFLTGLGMAMVSHTFGNLWVQIGFAGIVAHFILGAGFIRSASIRVQHAIAAPDETALRNAGRRLRLLNLFYLLILASVVVAMVLKPQ